MFKLSSSAFECFVFFRDHPISVISRHEKEAERKNNWSMSGHWWLWYLRLHTCKKENMLLLPWQIEHLRRLDFAHWKQIFKTKRYIMLCWEKESSASWNKMNDYKLHFEWTNCIFQCKLITKYLRDPPALLMWSSYNWCWVSWSFAYKRFSVITEKYMYMSHTGKLLRLQQIMEKFKKCFWLNKTLVSIRLWRFCKTICECDKKAMFFFSEKY